jgi:transposase
VNQRGPHTLFLTNPRVPIHNNLSERELRIVALLRKNALFVGSDEGGRSLAMLLSMSATCRLHGVDPERWLADVLIGVQEDTKIEPLLPWNWKHGWGLVARPVFATA